MEFMCIASGVTEDVWCMEFMCIACGVTEDVWYEGVGGEKGGWSRARGGNQVSARGGGGWKVPEMLC